MKIPYDIIHKETGKVIIEGELIYPDDISENRLAGSLAYAQGDLLEDIFEVKFKES